MVEGGHCMCYCQDGADLPCVQHDPCQFLPIAVGHRRFIRSNQNRGATWCDGVGISLFVLLNGLEVSLHFQHIGARVDDVHNIKHDGPLLCQDIQ